jgi:hypothetical protein
VSTIGFLHTSQVHVATFDGLVGASARVVHVVEPDLLDRARREGLVPSVEAGVRAALVDLVSRGAAVIVCTCSTIGPVAEGVSGLGVPVLRVDRPMAERAVEVGSRIGVVAAVGSTLVPTRELLAEEAARADVQTILTEVSMPAAWDLFEAGDTAGYLDNIAVAARVLALSGVVDVVVLAQASMIGVLDLLEALPVPVLVSPPLAVGAALAILLA